MEEAGVWGFHGKPEAQALFSGSSYHIGQFSPLARYHPKQRSTGRIAKWAIELGPHGLKYTPRTTIKSQALVDFINDWTELQAPEDKPDNTYWTIHFDGSRQLEGSGAGVVLTSPRGDKIRYVLRLMFPCTNNAAEYEALLHGLRMAKEMSLSRVRCFGGPTSIRQVGFHGPPHGGLSP